MSQKMTRRRLLLGGAATAAVVMVKSSFGKMVQTGIPKAATDPTKITGPLPGPLGTRSPFEQPVRKRRSVWIG